MNGKNVNKNSKNSEKTLSGRNKSRNYQRGFILEENEDEIKVLNNWILCWTRVPSVIEGNNENWIMRWVRITEP